MEETEELIIDTSSPPPTQSARTSNSDEIVPPADEALPLLPVINTDTLPPFYKERGTGSATILDDDLVGIESERAPVPGNCCHFSTITCSKFWAIFNLVQVFLCWILVCSIHLPTLVAQDPDDEVGYKLFKCMQGGSPGAQSTRLALQIILLLVYTLGSILFIVANFPPNQVVQLRPLFVKIFTWTLIAFLLLFVIPIIFHLPIGECYAFISLILWMILILELAACCVLIYFSWKIVKLFGNYLSDSSEEANRKLHGVTPPATPILDEFQDQTD